MTIENTSLTSDWNWLKAHSILLAVVIVLVLAGVFGVESLIAKHDHESFLREQALVQEMNTQNQQLQQQTKTQIDALTQTNIALQQQVSSLATAISNRDKQLQQTQDKIPTLTPDQLSETWQNQVKVGTVKPDPNGYLVDQNAATETVKELVSVPVLEEDKKDLVASNIALSTQIDNQKDMLDLEQKAHVSDNAACKSNLDLKDKQIADIKATNRKRNIIVGVFAFVAGIAAHAAGL